jgi:ferredoxin-type protein NapG
VSKKKKEDDDPKGVSRRELFTFWRRPRKEQPAPPPPPEPDEPEPEAVEASPERVLLRPPGAIFDTLFVDRCSRCGHCVDACPRQAIFPLDATWGRAAGTPAIEAREAPCVLCSGLHCMNVCPTHVLQKLAPFDIAMGTAVVDESRCVTYAGEACGKCVTSCPIQGALVHDADNHPQVIETRCIGCGLCEHVCPTEPASITVTPAQPIDR